MQKTVESLLQKYSFARRDSLIPILQEIQDEMGYLSEEAVVIVGKHLKIPTSKIYGLATFFNQFRFQPKGKYHIQVCHGTSCHMLGAMPLIDLLEKQLRIKSGQVTRNGLYSLEVIPCMGACAQSPVISVNGKFYKVLTPERLTEILKEIKLNE